MYQRLKRTVGRRGLYLLVFGAMWIIFGVGVWSYPQTRFGVSALPLLDSSWWAVGWWLAGSHAVLAGIIRSMIRIPTPYAFGSLVAMPTVWSLFYVVSEVSYLVGDDGVAKAWVSLCFWVAIVFASLMIAGWPDPGDPAVGDQLARED